MSPKERDDDRSLSLGGWFFLWMTLVAVAALAATLGGVLLAQYEDLEERLAERGVSAAGAALHGGWDDGSSAVLVTALPELVAAEVRRSDGRLVWQYGPYEEIDQPVDDGTLLHITADGRGRTTPAAEGAVADLILSTGRIRAQVLRAGIRLAGALLLVFAVAVVGGAFLVNRVVEPLRTLADEVGAFDPDDPDEGTPVGGAGREIRALADAYGRMKMRLTAERRALTASEQRFRGLFESSPVALLETDQDGAIVGANPAARLLLGPESPESGLVSHLPENETEVKRALRAEHGTTLAAVWHRPGEPPAEVELQIQPLAVGDFHPCLVAVRDISDRLRLLGRRWQQSLDEMREGVALLDASRAPIQENRAFAAFSQAVLPRVRQLEPRDIRHEWSQTVEDRSLRCVLAPVAGLDETVLVVRDETEWLQAEERLREAQKMEAIATLAGGVAHDFNNLLAGILLYVRLLEHDTEDRDEALASIRNLAEEGAEVVKGMLDFARPDAAPHATLDLVVLVREQESLLRHLLPETIELVVESGVEEALVAGDASALRRVLLNLVLNAREALGAGPGTIRISVAASPSDVVLEVADDGPGVPPSIEDRIFEPYLSLRREGRGAGLGLAVAFAIVQEHGGRLEHRRGVEGGAVFRVELPHADSPEG